MHSITSEENWLALKDVTFKYFEQVHLQSPQLSVEQLLSIHKISFNSLLCELAVQAGSRHEKSCAGDVCHDLAQRKDNSQPVEDPWINQDEIAQKDPAVMGSNSLGYGRALYGITPYGNHRKMSNGKSAVARRTTVNGQLLYRGYRYRLGSA